MIYQSCVQFECHSRTLAFPSMTWFGKKGVNSWMWIEWDCSHQPYESPFSSMNWHSQCCTFKDQFECQFKIELSGMCECWFHSELGTSLPSAHHQWAGWEWKTLIAWEATIKLVKLWPVPYVIHYNPKHIIPFHKIFVLIMMTTTIIPSNPAWQYGKLLEEREKSVLPQSVWSLF